MQLNGVERRKKRADHPFIWHPKHWSTTNTALQVIFGHWVVFCMSCACCGQPLIPLKYVEYLKINNHRSTNFHFTISNFQSYDELIRCTLTKDYIPIKSCTHPYSEQLIGLCDIMMDTDKQRRATINDIVCNPSIVIDYYRSYFDYWISSLHTPEVWVQMK